MKGQYRALERSDYAAILQCLKDGPKGAYDIRMDTGLSKSEWDTRRRDMLALGMLKQEGRLYVGGKG